MNERIAWSKLCRGMVKMAVAALTGTLVLLATADDPWDGDELIKGPAAGLAAYGGTDVLRKLMEEKDEA